MTASRAQHGFSLIEIMVVIIIIAVVIAGVGLSIGATSRVQLRSSCWTLTSAVRYAYSHAVTQGMTTRIVIDFENKSIHLEETRGRVVLNREDETGEGLRREGDDEYGPDGGARGSTLLDVKMNNIGGSLGNIGSGNESMGGPMSGLGMGMSGLGAGMGGNSGDGMMSNMADGIAGGRITDPFLATMQDGFSGNPTGYRRPRFNPLPGGRGESHVMEGNTTFVAVYTPHAPHPVEEGKAYVYFFPGGVTEHSIIQLSDGDDSDERIYSVEIHPITGRAIIHNEAIEPEEELDDLQEAEE
ncbi:MAG: prepilin-type N-terminal cleavage/methylation domain-containing protein [Proteobacteria bacterium]|nr:prepilin-type N-terminal cleavage/methylation domain-containing protein [Pseudomonadota bacterium]